MEEGEPARNNYATLPRDALMTFKSRTSLMSRSTSKKVEAPVRTADGVGR